MTKSTGRAATSLTSGGPQLRLIEPSSEQMLRDAFDLEDDLIDQLARVRRTQKDVRQRYAAERGLLILPGLETIRKALGK